MSLDRVARSLQSVIPDPFAIAIGLTVLAFALSLGLGSSSAAQMCCSQPTGRCTSACRISSQSPCAAATPRRNCPPRDGGPVSTSAPAASAMRRLASSEPPSVTTSSRMIPMTSPSPSAVRQPGSSPSAFRVGMITLTGARMLCIHCSIWARFLYQRRKKARSQS